MLLHLAGGQAEDDGHWTIDGISEPQDQAQSGEVSWQQTQGVELALQTGLEVREHS